MTLPPLRTPRLVLRPWTLDDIDELHALWTRPEVRRYLWDDEMISRQRAEDAVRANVAAADAEGTGAWMLLSAVSDQTVGFAGLIRLNPEAEPELLYGLAPEWWGRGYATEASQAIARYAFDGLGFSVLRASTDAPNVASQRVMERLGMRRTRRGDLNGLDTIFYELRREDFRAPDAGSATRIDTARR